MAYSTEQDPLLPNAKSSPEIQDSRPVSIRSTEDEEAQGLKRDSQRSKRLFNEFTGLALGLCAIFVFAMVFSPESLGRGSRPAPKTLDQRVSRILADTPLIDGHNDLAIFIRAMYNNHIYDDEFKKPFEEGGLPAHVDLPRLKEGKSGGAFWSAYVPCPKNGTDFSTANYAPSVAFTMDQIDLLTRLQQAYPSYFSPSVNSSTASKAFKAGQLISPIAIEGLHQIGNSIANLRLFHSLGVRYATLTHNCHNIYADAALLEAPHGIKVAEPYWGGVSPAGRKLVLEMNRIGMIVDLSHVSQDTMRDVLGAGEEWGGSRAPVMYSHSSAYAVCPHPRNVPDDILQLVKKTNSIVMVNFSPDFVSCTASEDGSGLPKFFPANATLSHVVTHIEHIGKLIGYDHVGLGSDFDGIPSTPVGLDDVSKFPDLVAELLKRGVSDEDASKVVGGNILRVWAAVDKVAVELQAAGTKPAEDQLPDLRWLDEYDI